MLEYVLFGQTPFEKFLAFIKSRGIAVETSIDGELYQVNTPEDIDSVISDEIEDYYEQMMALNQTLFEDENAAAGDFEAAGIVVSLKNGSTSYANVDGALLAKIMQVLSTEELGILVEAIVDAVDNPDDRPLCKRGST